MTKNSSETLLERYLSGSETAPFEIHARYQSRLVSLAKSKLLGVLKSRVDPEDISQETYQAFFDLADREEIRWQKEGDLWRLLAGIAINKVKQQFSHHSAAKRDLRCESNFDSQTDFHAPSQNERDEVSALSELTEHLLVSEKPLMKTILTLRLAGFTFEEIGKETRRSTRTVGRLLDSLKARIIGDQELASIFGIESETASIVDAASKNTIAFQTASYHDYQLLRMLGEGSFAKVYLARHIPTGHLFAIKAIKKKWLVNLKVRETFVEEVRVLAEIDDPHVVRIYGIGKLPNGGSFLVLEWIEGKQINEVIGQATKIERDQWWLQLRATIRKMHTAGIVHGDLRFENIMIDSENQLRIVDFGLGTLNKSLAVQANDLATLESLRARFFDNA